MLRQFIGIILFFIDFLYGLSCKWRFRLTNFYHVRLLISVLVSFSLCVLLSRFIRFEQIHYVALWLWNWAFFNLKEAFEMSTRFFVTLFWSFFLLLIFHWLSLFEHFLIELAIWSRPYSRWQGLFSLPFLLSIVFERVVIIGKTRLRKTITLCTS